MTVSSLLDIIEGNPMIARATTNEITFTGSVETVPGNQDSAEDAAERVKRRASKAAMKNIKDK